MKADSSLKKGEILQLSPYTTKNRMFAGCLMVVDEIKPWGAMGYVQSLGKAEYVLGGNGQYVPIPGGLAYYRAEWDEVEKTNGHIVFDCEFTGMEINGPAIRE